MSSLIEETQKRLLLNACLEEGRRLQSPRTEWIHTCYEEESRETIPVYENACFILALFRSKIGDQIQEAKELLEKLLYFQALSGNFPVYLHEYPQVKNRHLAVHLLVPFFWIHKLFSSILERPLRKKLDSSLSFLYQFCIRSEQERPFPPSLTAKLRGFEQQLQDHLHPETSIDWANTLMAYQMMGKIDSILPQALEHWNANLQTFCGPPIGEFQRGYVPETTLFDLFMVQATGVQSMRLFTPHLAHLHAAVVFPMEKLTVQPKASHSLTVSQKTPSYLNQKGVHLLRLLWGSADHPHTLVCQDKHLKIDQVSDSQFLFTYPDTLPNEKEGAELSFYLDHHPDVTLHINGEKGSLFQLGDEVKIVTPSRTFALRFTLANGEGVFCGHISQGNRPCQQLSNRFEAYDWKITIRTVRRTVQTQIQLDILE